MKKRVVITGFLLLLLLGLSACSKEEQKSTFSIQFIDVGQGDAALVECDGHYMLIDGGGGKNEAENEIAGGKVYNVFKEAGVKKLDILVASHLHADHIGGLPYALQALEGKKAIGITLSNSEYADTDAFRKFERELNISGALITVPENGTKYELGSAIVEVVDVSAEENNDSLVLLVTYKDARFLFTGDIEETAQTRIADKYHNDDDEPFKVDLVKLPHHGSYTGTLYRFLRTFSPDYVVVSVGKDNKYGHPHRETMEMLENKKWEERPRVYRTDADGDVFVTVKENGKGIIVENKIME